MALTTSSTPNNGSQTTTSGLQQSVAANGISGGTPSSIQPGTAASTLTSTGGITLQQTALSTVSLGTASANVSVAQPVHHKINAGLLGFSLTLLVFAIALFWYTGRAEKNTTKNYK
jgi:hypothetical protein